ncbi:hypothetical protein LY76DRAFT_526112 [Colletotrichum caudatum]|nr:hypothetical protein LY76DRAFT_526112 [Colletotrichum caudatum]
MECSSDESELAKKRIGAQIQLLRDEIERQFKRILTQTIEAHENDRKNNFERYTTRASLEHSPETFDRLKGWIRGQFPCYISGFQYSQGGSFSINFTNNPPPGAWVPTVVDMNKIFDQTDSPAMDVQEKTAAPTGLGSSASRPVTPSSTHSPKSLRSPPRRKPPRQKKTTVLSSARVEKSLPSSSQSPARKARRPQCPARKAGEQVGGKQILTGHATRIISENPSWAFPYNLGEGTRYYILTCPHATSGCRFSFWESPLENNLAILHFEKCKVPYSDEADIVRRYARSCKSTKSPRPPMRKQDLDGMKHAQISLGDFIHILLHSENQWSH